MCVRLVYFHFILGLGWGAGDDTIFRGSFKGWMLYIWLRDFFFLLGGLRGVGGWMVYNSCYSLVFLVVGN